MVFSPQNRGNLNTGLGIRSSRGQEVQGFRKKVFYHNISIERKNFFDGTR